jgi:3-ketoacyl-CoA synthase
MGVKSSQQLLAAMDVTAGGLKQLDADVNFDSLSMVRRSMEGALGPRLVSFKGLISPARDLNPKAFLPLLLVAAAQAASFIFRDVGPAFLAILNVTHPNIYWLSAMVVVVVILALLKLWWSWSCPTIYLVDYACFKPGDECKMTSETLLELAAKSKFFSETSLEFQRKILTNSGLGPETYVPLSMHAEPTDLTHATCMRETQQSVFSAVAEVLAKTGVAAREIGVLVVNCSTFCPIPSMSAMVVNHFGLREDIETFNLGGMGCSAGVVGISLAKDMLHVHKATYAIVVSTESISGLQGYTGNDRSMMVGNCIFRWGASAVLLSNKPSERRRAKYTLQHLVRTHKGANDRSFQCVKSFQDTEGIIGVSLSRDLMHMAGDALKSNITSLAPKILPLREKLRFVARKLLNQKPYTPNFQTAIDHFCIHPGGKAVLDGIEKNLNLSTYHMEPARMCLHRFGNTSSSAVWYELAYMEAKRRVRKGDLVWQIALGSGIKCNSAVWKSLRSDQVGPSANPWLDCVHRYPVSPLSFPAPAH